MTARRRVLGVGIVLLVALALPGFAGAQEVNGIWESRSWDDDRETDGAARIHLNLEPDRGNWRTGFGIDIDGAKRDRSFSTARSETVAAPASSRLSPTTPTSAVWPSWDTRAFSRERLFLFVTQDVTTEFVLALRQLGYGDLPESDLAKFAIHGVTADFIRGMNEVGYAAIPADQLVKLRIHGVSPAAGRRGRQAALHGGRGSRGGVGRAALSAAADEAALGWVARPP